MDPSSSNCCTEGKLSKGVLEFLQEFVHIIPWMKHYCLQLLQGMVSNCFNSIERHFSLKSLIYYECYKMSKGFASHFKVRVYASSLYYEITMSTVSSPWQYFTIERILKRSFAKTESSHFYY